MNENDNFINNNYYPKLSQMNLSASIKNSKYKNYLKRNYSNNVLHPIKLNRNNNNNKFENKNINFTKSYTDLLDKKIIKRNSKPNVIKNIKYNKLFIKLDNIINNNKMTKSIKYLPTQELTDSTFDKKLELSKIISKIKENRAKKERLINNKESNYKILYEKIKISRNKKSLKDKYINGDIVFDYINQKTICDLSCFSNNKLNFNNNSISNKKLEKIQGIFVYKMGKQKI